MRIIENPNPLTTHEHVCVECQCKFEYTERDIIKNIGNDTNGQIGGMHNYWSEEYVECPNCGTPFVIRQASTYGDPFIIQSVSDEEVIRTYTTQLT